MNYLIVKLLTLAGMPYDDAMKQLDWDQDPVIRSSADGRVEIRRCKVTGRFYKVIRR